jgi:hypothetical protein
MSHLEPTYLRYIHDSLIKGSIHPENSADLPDGLIGLYEEAFDERTSVTERQKLLQRFAIWALLKKAVSASFVAEVLNETEENILNFIASYSAWFNSPEIGKYQLYHQRLYVFILSKSSNELINILNGGLIKRLENADSGSEIDFYGLEFYCDHLLGQLKDLDFETVLKKIEKNALCSTYIDRQYKIDYTLSLSMKNLRSAILLNGVTYSGHFYKTILNSWQYILNKRHGELKNSVQGLIGTGKDKSFFINLSFIEDHELKFRLFNYVLRAFVISFEAPSRAMYKHFLEFSSREFGVRENFNWFSISGLTQNFIIETYFQVFLKGFDLGPLLEKGSFDNSTILHLFGSYKGNNNLISFVQELTITYSDLKRSETNFLIISSFHTKLNRSELQLLFEQIDSNILRLKAGILLSRNKNQISQKEKNNLFDLLSDSDKLEYLYYLVLNNFIQKNERIKKFIQVNVAKIQPEYTPVKDTGQMNQEEFWLAEDQTYKDWIIELSKKATVLVFIDKVLSCETLEKAINETDRIKNGGIKGFVLNYIFDEFRLYEDKEISDLGIKAKSKIPRISVGSLAYGQFLADNMIDLFEEEFTFGDKVKSRTYLLKAEREIPSLLISVKRDETRLRLLNKFLLLDDINRAFKQVGLIENHKIHFEAIQSIFTYVKTNQHLGINEIKKHISNKTETRFYNEYILNNENHQNFESKLFHYIDSLSLIEKEKTRGIKTFNNLNLLLNSNEPLDYVKIKKNINKNFSLIVNFSSIVNNGSFDGNLDFYRKLLMESSDHNQYIRLLIALDSRTENQPDSFSKELALWAKNLPFNSTVEIDKGSCKVSVKTYETIEHGNKTLPAMLSIRMGRSSLESRWDELIPFHKYNLEKLLEKREISKIILDNNGNNTEAAILNVQSLFTAVRSNNIEVFKDRFLKIKIPSGMQLKMLINFVQQHSLDPGSFLKVIFTYNETKNSISAYSAYLFNQLQYKNKFMLQRHDVYFTSFILNNNYVLEKLKKSISNVR